MNPEHRVVSEIQLDGAVLGFDVDWPRRRIVAIIDGGDGLVQMNVDDDGFHRGTDLGAAASPPDGRAATSVALHPDADVVATAGWDRPLRIWDLEAEPRRLRDVGDPSPPDATRSRRGFLGAGWSSCGRYLDTHNLALERGQRFEWATGRLAAERWGHDGPFVRHPRAELLALAIGADASSVYFAVWDGPVALWLPVAIDLFVPCKPAFAAGSLAAVGGTSCVHAIVYDVPTLRPRFARKLDLVDEDVAAEFGVSQALALSPDGAALYVPGADGEIVALAGHDGADRGRWRAHTRMVTQLAHHPDAGYLLSAGLDGKVVLSVVPLPGPARAEASEARALVDRYPPMARDPEGMPRGSVAILDAPW